MEQKENPQTPIKQIGKENSQGANTIDKDRQGKCTDTYQADRRINRRQRSQGAVSVK